MIHRLTSFLLALVFSTALTPLGAADPDNGKLFAKENLWAWCIVPFDAKKRGPEERAAMLEKLGLRHFAYDYRPQHLPTFDAECEALKKHGISLDAWWFSTTMNEEARHTLQVFARHGVKPQLWVNGGGAMTKTPEEQATRIETEATRIKPIAEAAAAQGCKVGLYNHGSWFGEPENQLAIIERLKRDGITNVGMVYNLHHGHAHLDRFAALLPQMIPHLFCLNLNGMKRGTESILPVGQGDLDLGLLKTIRDSGYRGPIGILNHTDEDAEVRLKDNLDGLAWLVKQLDGKDAGPKPKPLSWKGEAVKSAAAKAQNNGITIEGKKEYRTLPITVECRAKLNGTRGYNILIACDPKTSASHWELYTHAGSGELSLYLPGRGGDYRSKTNICDSAWHDLAAVIEEEHVRLLVDGKQVHEATIKVKQGQEQPGDLAFGQLVGGGRGCDGEIDQARISKGARSITADMKLHQDEATLGFWDLKELAKTQRAAEFTYDYAPLHPEQWPHKDHPINEHRIYDFYTKEALHFMKQRPVPALLPEFPGLEGGTYGHWGTQNDETTWKDGRWNETDIGNVMAGVFRGAGVTIVKGVSVRLGDQGELAACFDPLTLNFPIVWKGGFVGFDPHRHGFMNGTIMKGEMVEKSPQSAPAQPFVYHGYYRHGKRVIFAYQLDGKECFDSAWVENGKFIRERSEKSEFTKGGPTQWPQWIETKGELGTAKPYTIDTLPLPVENQWKTLFFVSGHDFFANGDAALCTMTGEVWLCRGIDAGLQHLRWKRFATGLHQPLGLKIVDDQIYVLGRDQITCLHDLNGDDEADFYECVSNAQTTSAGGHDFITGLERDAEGRFYFASGNQGLCRVKPGQALEVIATGFRNPNGLGLAADGTLTTNAQEGDWTPASAIYQIKQGGFYGYGGPKPGITTEPALQYLPRGLDNSCGGQCFTQSDRWGPLGGQLIHCSSGSANHLLILREKIGETWQGAAVLLPGDFLSGLQQARINPKDGQFYASGLFGWGTYAPKDGCFQRVRYTGGPAHLPVALETHENGVLLTFSDPIERDLAGKAESHFAQEWNYLYSRGYGSPEFSVRHPELRGHDPLEITSVQVLDDKRLFLEIPQLLPAHTVHLHVSVTKETSQDIYITATNLGAPFKGYAGYKAITKELPIRDVTVSTTLPPAAKTNPWALAKNPGRAITLDAALGLQYAQKQLVAKAGERLSLTFKNPDVVPHNFVLVQRGKLQAMGDLANKLIADPEGLLRHYVPNSGEVLVYTDMTNPGDSFTIHFNAPKEPGEYPYLCTFPGHWQVMNGVMKVE